ncbi:MAG: O-methyltransferase [Solirubrobacteraceae bacterium]
MPSPSRPVTPVGILACQLGHLCDRAQRPGATGRELLAELHTAHALAAGLEPYVSRCTTPESSALAALSQRTQAHDWERRTGPEAAATLEQEMLSGHVEGQALKFLVRMTRARRVLELGMFTGYSALAVAEALPADGRVVACELDPDVAAFAQRSFDETPSGAKIEVRIGRALATLEQLASAGETYDFVFIDADKAGYGDYVSTVLDRGLLAPDGVICVDNTLLQGEPYLLGEPSANGAAIAAFNETIAGDPRIEQVLLPLRDGMTLIRRA